MTGKEKCKALKKLRAQIAEANEIQWITEECTYEGECPGTCPRCEEEVRMLEEALECRRKEGKSVVKSGFSVDKKFGSEEKSDAKVETVSNSTETDGSEDAQIAPLAPGSPLMGVPAWNMPPHISENKPKVFLLEKQQNEETCESTSREEKPRRGWLSRWFGSGNRNRKGKKK